MCSMVVSDADGQSCSYSSLSLFNYYRSFQSRSAGKSLLPGFLRMLPMYVLLYLVYDVGSADAAKSDS